MVFNHFLFFIDGLLMPCVQQVYDDLNVSYQTKIMVYGSHTVPMAQYIWTVVLAPKNSKWSYTPSIEYIYNSCSMHL